jgi:predicted transcriptional regulator
MSKSSLRNEISELARALSDAIVKAINAHPLHELAALTEGSARPARREAAPAPAKESPARKSAPAKKAKPAPKKKPAPVAKKTPVSPAELRADIVAVLQSSKEWMKASALIAAAKKKPTNEALGRVLRQLLAEGHIAKQGATRNTEYQITASGLAL